QHLAHQNMLSTCPHMWNTCLVRRCAEPPAPFVHATAPGGGSAGGVVCDAGGPPTRRHPMSTHEVSNQPPPRVDVDEFAANIPLVEAVHRYDAAWALADLQATGALVGSAEFQRDAEAAHTHAPVLRTHDRYGHRIDHVDYHPGYHRILGAAVAAGAHTSAWADPRAGAQVARAAQFMLFAQVEPGHACPVS